MPSTDRDITRRTVLGVAGSALAASAMSFKSDIASAQSFQAGNVSTLENILGYKVFSPRDPDEYDAARFIWNALQDSRPALIVPCHSAQDVAHCIRFAREHRLALSVRSGGHHVAGFSMKDGGLVIDLSGMNSIKVDAKSRRVVAGPSARVAELCMATEPFKLVVPTAACSTVGVGGMTTGGGEGFFGEYGLSADCLVSAEIVTADSRVLRIDKTTEPDLFWAIRGGSGNFGVVTSLEFQAHPLPDLTVGFLAYPLPLATQAGLKWRDHVASSAPDFSGGCAFVRKPVPAMMIISKFGRPAAEAQSAFEQLRALTPAVQSISKPVTLTGLQALNDLGNDAGGRYFAYSHYAKDLTPEILDICRAAIEAAPSENASIAILKQNDRIGEVAVDATAYPHRGARFSLLAQTRWDEKKEDDRNIQWTKDWWQKVLPHATGGIYCNYVGDSNPDVAARAYGANYARLSRIKRRYDPENIFASTVNILPA